MRLFSRALLLLCAAAVGPLGALHACTRHADLREDSLVQTFDPGPELDADIQELDADLASDAHPACDDRPVGDCVGSNDFLCGFSKWAIAVSKQCQVDTGCKTNGSIELTMGATGCVTGIAMDQPDDDLVACVVSVVSSFRCPCVEEETALHDFGLGNDGTCPEP